MRFLILLIFVFSFTFLNAQSASEVYIDKFDSLAVEVLTVFKIPASLVLGVALFESAAGASKLCKQKRNHFGIKSRIKSSKTRSGYILAFRKFDTDEASYLYFGEMIARKKYYNKLKGNMDYMQWLKAMKAAKYATSSTWISRIDKIIKRYNLTRYDVQETLTPAVVGVNADTIPVLQK